MKRIGLKIPKLYRYGLFAILALSWFTGLGFFLLETFFQIEGEFGLQKHPLQNPALTIHGGSAFLMMMAYGALLSAHVPMGWRTKRLRYWGLALIFGIGSQVFTAFLLYYISGLILREAAKWVHLVVGASLPAILAGHVVAGIKAR